MSLPFLETIGLTKNEADLYELLLKLGEVPANRILKETNLKRATAYKSLYTLEKKGLITKQDKGKIIHFKPEPPSKLLDLAENQYKELERATENVRGVLPELSSAYVLSVEKPVIRVFEGVEGIKKAHLELLAEKKPIEAYVTVNEAIDKQLDNFWKKYYAIRKRDNIFARVISPDTKQARQYQKLDTQELRETRLISNKAFPNTIEKDIVGNKVAFFSMEGDKLIATLIENKPIADTERAIFELVWNGASHV